MLKVVDRFTTQDGEWYVSNKPYSITKEALARWSGEDIPGKGGATHIFVLVPFGAMVVEFNTSDGRNRKEYYTYTNGNPWVNHPISKDAAYNPDDNVGPWHVRIDGELVAEGIGLPHSWHVSTFLVVEDVEPVAQVPPTVPTFDRDKVQFIVNGVVIYSN